MSVVQTASIFCDGPGPDEAWNESRQCIRWEGEATTTQGGSREARRQAKRAGWIRRDGLDLCPDCQEVLAR